MKMITAEWNGQQVTMEIPIFIYEGAVRGAKRSGETLESNVGMVVQAIMDAAYEVDGDHFPSEQGDLYVDQIASGRRRARHKST